MRDNKTYAAVEAGDISKQLAIREKLECKSFKWFMEEIAPDVIRKYPLHDPPDYAWGAIQSITHPKYCVDLMSYTKPFMEVGIWECGSITDPHNNQHLALSGYRDMRDSQKAYCWDVLNEPYGKNTIHAVGCHRERGNQFWYYDYVSYLVEKKFGKLL